MSLFSIAKTGSVADILVKCECEKTRSASDAFGERRSEALGQCSRHRPWLGIGNRDSAACIDAEEVRAMQRGATNGWFPVVRSALAVKEAATPIGIALNGCSPKQIEKVDSEDKLKTLVEMGMFPSLESFPVPEVWNAIQKQRGEVETDDIDLRWPEWLAFRDPGSASSDKMEFFLELGEVPDGYREQIARVVLARKLLEVRALVGFTRYRCSWRRYRRWRDLGHSTHLSQSARLAACRRGSR